MNGWFKFSSLHTVIVWFETTGSEVIETFILKGVPTHPFPEVGVIVYSTVTILTPVFVMVPITFWIPVSPTVTPLTVPVICVISHVKLLATAFPPGVILSWGLKLNELSEQTVSLESIPTGSVSIVTVTVNGSPRHPLSPTGTNVYTTSRAVLVILFQESLLIASLESPFCKVVFPDAAVNPMDVIFVRL